MNTLTVSDLARLELDAPTYALFGWPVGHSVSPQLHHLLFAAHGRECQYLAVAVAPDELPEALALARQKLVGVNLTIPHKRAVLPLLDAVDPAAQALGAVNTVHFHHGRACGYNTDLFGFAAALARDGVALSQKHVCMLGCGGVSTVMAQLALQQGARLSIAARNRDKAEACAQSLRRRFAHGDIDLCTLDQLPEDAHIVLNATPVGMSPVEDACPLAALPKECEYVFDAIYNPPLTALLRLARRQGVREQDGLYMLIAQAARAQEIWLGQPFSHEDIQPVVEQLYADLMVKRLREVHGKNNLVLCGFMGSGKTTLGRRLAQLTGWTMRDCDQLLEEQAGCPVSEIFAREDEEGFRAREKALLLRLCQGSEQILSTGGGCVLDPDNVSALRQSGFVIHLDPPVEAILQRLADDQTRPLLQRPDREAAVYDLHQRRATLYAAASDRRIVSSLLQQVLLDVLRCV